MEKGPRMHKMDDWERYRRSRYESIIQAGQSGGLEEKKIALRIIANQAGIYETLKAYDVDGVAYNDGSWIIYTTSRMVRHGDQAVYKDKVFCWDKNQVIDDLYSYILFLRKVGIDVVYEMNYYAVAFLVKYLRFYNGVFDCTWDNQRRIGELCRSAVNKAPEEIDCASRKDSREFAFDPDVTRKMSQAVIITWQKSIRKQMKDAKIRKWYDPKLSVRKNLEIMNEHKVDVSLGRLQQWIQENIRA